MYKIKKTEEIKADILSAIGSGLDTREGSFSDDMAGPLSVELFKMYSALDAIKPMVWVDETSGKYLDMAAEDMGLERKPGSSARVTLYVQGEPGYVIPAGTTFITLDNLFFDTLVDNAIGDEGWVLVEAAAREEGLAYNVAENTVIYTLRSDRRINNVTNPGPGEGGADPESDRSLYARIVLARQKPATSGNAYHYEQWALETPGVGAVRVVPLWDGPGTVKVLVADEDRQPLDDAIVEACAIHIEEVRPIGAEVTVRSVRPYTVRVSAKVHLRNTVSPETVEEEFRRELTAYLKSISLERFEVLYNRVGGLLVGMEGVIDYDDLLLNDEQANLYLESEQVPVLGEVAFTWN